MPSPHDRIRKLVTSKQTALSTMRLQPSSFTRPGSYSSPRANTRERRVTVTFSLADTPTPIYHGLGFAPSGYQVLGIGVGDGSAFSSGAKVYNDFPIPASSRVIVLKCDTANAIADILVR